MTIPLQSAWAYGPVASRRFGRSLGVNLSPLDHKLCNFDCVYCQYDETPGAPTALPTPEQVEEAVERALRAGPCDSVTIAGNGEPTLHPEFARIVERLAQVRDRHAPGAALTLLSNGTRLSRPEVRAGLARLDRSYFKLDAGDEQTLRAIARPRGFNLERLLFGLRALRPVPFGLQALFVRGARTNAAPDVVDRWVELVLDLGPREVHVTTLERGPTLPGLLPVEAARLEELADALRRRGVAARAFPCTDEGAFARA